jgi:two-component system LytT family response regulator
MKKSRVIVIDDERSSREELKRMLKNYSDFEVVGEAAHADEAKGQIETKHPDLILLDVQMPEKSGFDLLESLNEAPVVIFITAFNEYAIQAFEMNALDYLMKPVREERFAKAIEKAGNSISAKLYANQPDRQIFIKDGDKCYFVRMSEIYLIESLENYSRLYFNDKKIVLKRSLRQWEEILDTGRFFRISRTQIINTSYIEQVYQQPKSRLTVKLKTGQLLEVSVRQSVKFKSTNGI